MSILKRLYQSFSSKYDVVETPEQSKENKRKLMLKKGLEMAVTSHSITQLRNMKNHYEEHEIQEPLTDLAVENKVSQFDYQFLKEGLLWFDDHNLKVALAHNPSPVFKMLYESTVNSLLSLTRDVSKELTRELDTFLKSTLVKIAPLKDSKENENISQLSDDFLEYSVFDCIKILDRVEVLPYNLKDFDKCPDWIQNYNKDEVYLEDLLEGFQKVISEFSHEVPEWVETVQNYFKSAFIPALESQNFYDKANELDFLLNNDEIQSYLYGQGRGYLGLTELSIQMPAGRQKFYLKIAEALHAFTLPLRDSLELANEFAVNERDNRVQAKLGDILGGDSNEKS